MSNWEDFKLMALLSTRVPNVPYSVALLAIKHARLSNNPLTTAIQYIVSNHPEALI